MKKFLSKLKVWFINHKPSKRRLIQVYAALLYNANIKGFVTGKIYTGNTKYTCVPGLNCYSCPGAVGACPMGAIQNALSASNTKAPYYVLGIIALFCILLGRTICGFLCPVGLGQELLYKIKTPKLKKNRVTKVLSYLKYVILVVLVIILPIMLHSPTFCKYICPAGTLGGGIGLLAHPENADFFAMLSGLFTWKFALLVAIIVLSIFIFRFFCRFLCPLGALYGLFNKIALIGVKLDHSKCTDCGLCISHCKMDISHVGDHECVECGECIAVCPTQAISWKGSKIFLHPNAVEKEEKAPALSTLLKSGSSVNLSVETVEETAESTNVAMSDKDAETSSVTVETVVQEEAFSVADNTEKPKKEKKLSPAERVKRRNKWLEVAAWSLAGLFLVFVLVYYNFLAKESDILPRAAGDTCPDFITTTYEGEGNKEEFKLSDYIGEKIVVINFWAVWCDPCVEEIPHFNKFQEDYADDVVVIAFHQAGDQYTDSRVQSFIDTENAEGKSKESWTQYSMKFAKDGEKLGYDLKNEATTLYSAMGGKNVWPMTVIVNKQGKIADIRQGKMSYEELQKKVVPLF
ncbi:MAG: 4Fe-4S binding protein [Clostridia bacterium]|nr:4Fe-4S binding protein [Clostridia bacterium]